MRLIDADKLNTDIVVKRNALDTSAVVERGGYIALNKVLTMIEEQPTIEERKTGKWIESQLLPNGRGRLFICSECNKGWAKQDRSMDGINYCPNCGAYMRGDKNEDDS